MSNDFLLNQQFKGFPTAAQPCLASTLKSKEWNVLDGDLPYPAAVLRSEALEHNLAWMHDFVTRKGVAFAPHGKTTMSPELFSRQLQAGAWGLTFATVYQLSVGVEAGVRRAIIANQVLCDADLDGLNALIKHFPALRVWFLIDSLSQLASIEDWAKRRNSTHRFDTLLEIGVPGQRTGCRTLEEAVTLAKAIASSSAVQLGGVECYEGGVARCDSEHDTREVTALVRRVTEATRQCDALGLFSDSEIMLTAGGSAVFDLVVPLLRTQGMSKPVLGVLRSGCYITHDHGNYRRFLKHVEQREGLDASLRPALEVWTMVQSVPEAGLALLSGGRRDLSYDLEMPIPVRWALKGSRQANETPADWTVTALNDHHAYLRYDPNGPAPVVGDRVALGISHPCTTFDKWRWLPLVNEDFSITDAISTRF
ncbi:D-threonine aldolase [Curvibacter sp. AEP1-3]|uniref:amino acid deaminase n=1 Tax=Curvibacter sp. AEP1-3 TaxID=1844971 RepID=UPI000B3CDB36|nr:amino acid deaminase [Curvibacter sp. AEP1-3]ARV19928.1 D-threonine aldolase [Curvibacter sp. AEP1-3]